MDTLTKIAVLAFSLGAALTTAKVGASKVVSAPLTVVEDQAAKVVIFYKDAYIPAMKLSEADGTTIVEVQVICKLGEGRPSLGIHLTSPTGGTPLLCRNKIVAIVSDELARPNWRPILQKQIDDVRRDPRGYEGRVAFLFMNTIDASGQPSIRIRTP